MLYVGQHRKAEGAVSQAAETLRGHGQGSGDRREIRNAHGEGEGTAHISQQTDRPGGEEGRGPMQGPRTRIGQYRDLLAVHRYAAHTVRLSGT